MQLPTMRSADVKGTIVLVPLVLLGKKCNIMLSDTPSSDTYLHFLRENGDKAHISRFTRVSQSAALLFFIPVEYLSLLQSLYQAMWSGGHSGEGTVFL